MEQKSLTEKQHEIIGRLEKLLKEAQENKILFVCDSADCSLSAFNGENVEDFYQYYGKPENDSEEKIDWDSTSMLENILVESFNSNIDDIVLVFSE